MRSFDGRNSTGTGVIRQVGGASNTSQPATGATEVNLCTVTIPVPINGRKYRASVSGLAQNNTAGEFTNFFLRRGLGANVGGTQFGRAILDQRMANRTQTVSFWGDFVYADATGASPYNIVLVMSANGASTSTSRGDITPMRIAVDEIL